MKEELGTFDIGFLRHMGMNGWEIVGVIPRTIGVVTENSSFGSTIGTTWGGGSGGNVAGVHILLRKEVKLNQMDDSLDDELGRYLSVYLPEFN